MTRKEAIQFIDNIKHGEAGRAIGSDGFFAELMGYHVEALQMAIEALEFMEKYDAVWEEIKYAGEHGQEIEFHRYGRVYRIREVAT